MNAATTMSPRVPLREGLLTTIDEADARLVGGRCPHCARHHFPAELVCPYCGADGCTRLPLSATGVLRLCTTVANRPPGYNGPLPFGFGVVELPEGLQIITRIARPERCIADGPVRLCLETLHTDADGREVVTFAFAPAGDQGER